MNKCDFIVCKDMFLRTLGYKYDTVITKMFGAMPTGSIKPVKDQRGRHKPKHAFSLNIIESFKPMISHYRRNHAPLRRYLPPELSPKVMHEHLCQSRSDIKCCGETYRLRVKNKNIGFGRLGEEECEVCVANIQHECNAGLITNEWDSIHDRLEMVKKVDEGICENCDNWVVHIERANKSREEYRNDADSFPEDDVFYVSADMQKVIMLPRLPGMKTSLFTRRMILYHETYAPLVHSKETRKKWATEKKQIRRIKPTGIIWHERLQGRYAEDVSSTVLKFLRHPKYRDAKRIVIWADNCTGQLKNWTLYSSLVNNHGSISNITMKYLGAYVHVCRFIPFASRTCNEGKETVV